MVSLTTLVAALLSFVAPPAGPCDLLAKATVTALLGQPAPSGRPQGPEKDEDTGGMMSYCTYQIGQSALIISEVTFANPAAARKATTQELVKSRLDDDAAVVKEEAGVGDRAFWATTDRGAQYVVLKGAKVVAVALGGRLSKPAKSYHDALRSAGAEAAGVR